LRLFRLYRRATPVARERDPTTPHAGHAHYADTPIRRYADTCPLDSGDRRRMVGKGRKVRHHKGRLWVGEKISNI